MVVKSSTMNAGASRCRPLSYLLLLKLISYCCTSSALAAVVHLSSNRVSTVGEYLDSVELGPLVDTRYSGGLRFVKYVIYLFT